MNIGKAIKELRVNKKLNQSELAEACGLTQTSLSQIENGIKTPKSRNDEKIMQFF
ncbi:helix-turn-helix domain-containing protein [Mucilaginibacter sp. UC70_90]